MARDGDAAKHGYRVGNHELHFGVRFWVALFLAIGLVAIGMYTSPRNLTAGVLVGVAGVIGALLGVLLDITPVSTDRSVEARSAIRALHRLSQDIESIQARVTLIAAERLTQRAAIPIALVSEDLEGVRTGLYSAIVEWDRIAPGSSNVIEEIRTAGSELLAKLSKEDGRSEG
ncbi:hypothetical protein [Curtobacterium sp. MCBD17_013]|uniref:hypothetical protein n=1 Tax=Curtobacterium sp. MCBD17_013 TaxID=2175668 RepID=UPI0011B35774|nr:hypothetical protein [Curtobacterium sp. MCBD17_013]